MKEKYRKIIWVLVFIVSFLGLYMPKLGLLMYPMFISIMFFGYFKNRYWCSTICPRGSFFDVILKKISLKKSIPSILKNNLFQILVLIILMGMFILNVKKAFNFWGNTDFLDKLGMVGVMMCLVTTIIGILLGYFIHHRSWCVFCPMGTVQKSLFKLNKKVEKIKTVLR